LRRSARQVDPAAADAGAVARYYGIAESRKDAELLSAHLAKAFGDNRVFLDVHGIDGGDDWLQTLERQVAASAAMVVLIGKDWADLKDDHGNRRLDDPDDKVSYEISQALLRNLPVIPVSIDRAPVPKATQLPDNLIRLSLMQAMPLRTESFTADAAAIARRLEALLAKQEQHGVPIWPTGLGLLVMGCVGSMTPMAFTRLGLPFPGLAAPADLATAEKARDDARKELNVANATVADFERKLASKPAFVFTFRDCADCPEMVQVPAAFNRLFAVAKFPVTFDEWDACVAGGGCSGNTNPDDNRWGRGKRPVIYVSWNDAKEYVNWLSRRTGKPYRLLSEAEYEYAARAGTNTRYPWGDEIDKGKANCRGCGSPFSPSPSTTQVTCQNPGNNQTAPVGSFPPNQFSLYDMIGNVWEWVEDCKHTGRAPVDGSA
jgi:hypothetical protein